MASLHCQVRLVLRHAHLLQDVGILNVKGQRIGEYIVHLHPALCEPRLALRLRSELSPLPHAVEVFPVLLGLVLPPLLLVPPDFLGPLGVELKLFLLLLYVVPREVLLSAALLNLLEQVIPIEVLALLVSLAGVDIEELVSLALVLDVLLDEGVLHQLALGERTHVGVSVAALIAHEHVVVLRRRTGTFL